MWLVQLTDMIDQPNSGATQRIGRADSQSDEGASGSSFQAVTLTNRTAHSVQPTPFSKTVPHSAQDLPQLVQAEPQPVESFPPVGPITAPVSPSSAPVPPRYAPVSPGSWARRG